GIRRRTPPGAGLPPYPGPTRGRTVPPRLPPGDSRAAAAGAASGRARSRSRRSPAVSAPTRASRPFGSPCFASFRQENRRIGLVYSSTYHKGCYASRPAGLHAMNDRPKKAVSTPALELARKVLAIEADAVSALSSRLDERFLDAIGLILACRGRVVVSGVGK